MIGEFFVKIRCFLNDTGVKILCFQRGKNQDSVFPCCRCKNKDEVSIRQNQAVSLICGKCSNACMVAFRPAIVHQFSSILGYLDFKECHAFDLILSESEFMVGCGNCNKDMKIQVNKLHRQISISFFLFFPHCSGPPTKHGQLIMIFVSTVRV